MASITPPDYSVFVSAATAFADLVALIPATSWDGPGLGDWDLRSLVGHTSRSLITVSSYLRIPAEREDVTGPAHYYALLRGYAAGSPAIVERGREAGRVLGADPSAKVTELLHQVLTDLDGAGDPLIAVIGGLGIRLSNYLPTRVFELTVHSLDIARHRNRLRPARAGTGGRHSAGGADLRTDRPGRSGTDGAHGTRCSACRFLRGLTVSYRPVAPRPSTSGTISA